MIKVIKSKSLVTLIYMSFILTACSSNIIVHDEHMAADVAEFFLNAAIIKKDFKKSYELLSEDVTNKISVKVVKDTTIKMHPTGFPNSITAIEYEPVHGQKAIVIYLVGEKKSEKFHYRVGLTGSKLAGYKVTGFFRGSNKYPESNMKKIIPEK